ncbi:hypothetical protein I302_102231 [Kwoniella bestiolae CBS 10118]|uniref:Uncharacterized protein n=1 Tax=Kwoniella bestiolae CBS 10118 TaxID=1296100 RepID=A0A1B9GEJ8_9TREE|nr:hypothetical protein I302_00920 [Kwoniella bestiolae CBS 10118]OCF29415.1 hypothetical protein I302_00920 [Kwoniella bestiolae CBS 10118]
MPRKTTQGNKRTRSPSRSDTSNSGGTPPPQNKKPRISRNSKTPVSIRKITTSKSKAAAAAEEKDDPDDIQSQPSSGSSPPFVSQDQEDDEAIIERSTAHPRDDEVQGEEAIKALMGRIDREEFIKLLGATAAEFLRKGEEVVTEDVKPKGKGHEGGSGRISKVQQIWEGVVETWEDPEGEGESEHEEEAENLANALGAPFERLQAHSSTSLNEVTYTINQALQNALEHFKADTIPQNMRDWRDSLVEINGRTKEHWDKTVAFIAAKKEKMQGIIKQIHEINKQKGQIIEQAKKDFESALERHAIEMEGYKQGVLKSKEKYKEQLIKAQDKESIGKEVNMAFKKLLDKSTL